MRLQNSDLPELRKQQTWSDTRFFVFHYREASGVEVDVLLEFDDGRVLGLEVKAMQTYSPSTSAVCSGLPSGWATGL